MTPIVQPWQPITDLAADDLAAASSELPALASVWADERARLGDDQGLAQFNERLAREWAIETGVIERIYTLDRGTTEVLIEHGIDAALIPHDATDQPPELVAAIINDQRAAVDGLFDVVATWRPLTTSYFKELHALITRHQRTATGVDQFGNAVEVELLHGAYKERPNNPARPDGTIIHEYCPPVHVATEMERLVALHAEHLASGVPPEVAAAWLHRRFTQIHPFQDGRHRAEVLEATRSFDYLAGLSDYSAWVRLGIDTESGRGDIIVSFHSIGREFRGVVGAVMLFVRRSETEDGIPQVSDATVLGAEPFQVNHRETEPDVVTRFRAWLEQGLVQGLDTWRRTE